MNGKTLRRASVMESADRLPPVWARLSVAAAFSRPQAASSGCLDRNISPVKGDFRYGAWVISEVALTKTPQSAAGAAAGPVSHHMTHIPGVVSGLIISSCAGAPSTQENDVNETGLQHPRSILI
jgi:hypothetical protein